MSETANAASLRLAMAEREADGIKTTSRKATDAVYELRKTLSELRPMVRSLETSLAEAQAELARCGGANCLGMEVDGVRSWVAKEALTAAEQQLAEVKAQLDAQAGVIRKLETTLEHIRDDELDEPDIAPGEKADCGCEWAHDDGWLPCELHSARGWAAIALAHVREPETKALEGPEQG